MMMPPPVVPDGRCRLCRRHVVGHDVCHACRILVLNEDRNQEPVSTSPPTLDNICQCSSVSVTIQSQVPLCDSCGSNLTDFRSVYFDLINRVPEDISTLPSVQTSSSASHRDYAFPLIQQDCEIRLAVLHPGTVAEPIHCTLVRVGLDNLPPFDAVSYTWADGNGDSSACKSILCGTGRRHLAVTANCENVLRRLRLIDMKRLIWLDALCIDQSNIEERNNQVRWVSQIYSRAARVLVYLGEATKSSTALFSFLNEPAQVGQDLLRKSTLPRKLPERSEYSQEQVIPDLTELFSRPWFFRTWVLQEVAFAKQVVAICGPDFVPWDALSILNLNLTRVAFDRRRGPSSWSQNSYLTPKAVPLAARLQHGLDSQSCHLWNLLTDTRDCKASDPRDKVFAILGLANDMGTEPFLADYSKSVMESFEDFAAYLLAVLKVPPEDLLLQCEGQRSSLNLPSWVPDWSVGQARRPLTTNLMPHLGGREIDMGLLQPATTTSEGKVLTLRGKCIDAVREVDVASTCVHTTVLHCIISDMPANYFRRHIGDPVNWIRGGWKATHHKWKTQGSMKCSSEDQNPLLDSQASVGISPRPPPAVEPIMEHLDRLFSRASDTGPAWEKPPAGPHIACYDCIGPLFRSFRTLQQLDPQTPRQRTLFLGERSIFIGLGPPDMVKGDVVCLINGLEVPWVLRPHDDGYKLVGQCAFFDPPEHCGKCAPETPRDWKDIRLY